jgi:general secretion pathway protein I
MSATLMRGQPGRGGAARGFTLIEVLVALAIVAFGMGAVLAALNQAAGNLAALRERTLAQWVALNQVADTRLNLQAPMVGVTEGDLKGFGNGDWHWRQEVVAVDTVPGLLQITVHVRRSTAMFGSSSSSGSGNAPVRVTGTASVETNQNWLVSVVGFRGDALGAASGMTPDWTGTSLSGAAGASSSSSGGSSSGLVPNPGTNIGSSSGASSGGTANPTTTQSLSPGNSSGGA